MTIRIEWHEPPPTGKYGLMLTEFVDALKERPGEWGELLPPEDEEKKGFALSVQTAVRKRWPTLECRTVTLGTRGRVRLFARWTSDDPETEARGKLKRVQ